MRLLLVAVLATAVLPGTCAPGGGAPPTYAPTSAPVSPTPTGIPRDDAIRIATANGGGNGTLVSAEVGQSGPWGPLDHPDVVAWIVTFHGNYPMECPAPATGTVDCPDLHTAVVVLDYFTGEFISGTYTE